MHPSRPKRLPLSQAERAEIQRQGAKAAARGEPAGANPLDQPRNRPLATGESPDRWRQRSAAWEQGHAAQRTTRRTERLLTARTSVGEHD